MSEELKNLYENKWVRLLCVLLCIFIFLVVNNKMMVEKTANKVIEKLRNEYVPGPYAPGFDPDKVSPDLWEKHESTLRNLQWRDSKPDEWNEQWEAQRADSAQ